MDINQKSIEELQKENEKLQKENEKANKRLNRIVTQGDRQHKEFEKLNEKLGSYIGVIDDHVISLVVDENKNITDASTLFSNRFGFKKDELIEKNFEFLLKSDDVQKINAELHDTVASRIPWHGELRFKNKSDTIIWTSTIITPNFDEDKLVGFTFIIEDISKEQELKNLKARELENKKYNQSMLEYMSSRSSALLQSTSNSFSYIIWLLFATVVWSIVWANYAQLEELTRGSGKIIPSKQIKKVENFDNVIIQEILVSEGDFVKKGQLLIRFNNIENTSSVQQNMLRLNELNAKAHRLELQSNFNIGTTAEFLDKNKSAIFEEEYVLYMRNTQLIQHKISAIDEKILQKQSELNEAKKKEGYLKGNFKLLAQELKIKEKMVKEKIISQIEFIQLKREKNDLSQEINKIQSEIKRYKSSISELKQNKQEAILEYSNKSKQEYHEVLSEIKRLDETRTSLSNILTRDEVYSPVDGTIKKMYVNTIGEVSTAGNTIMEIVPIDEDMITEVQIAPEDIAYLKVGQEAMMKFSAYDYNIYGGIKSKISYISADSIKSPEDNKNYYIVHLTMENDHIKYNNKKLPLKVGMVANVDIIHGKKSVMDYILKPILKAKQNALTEK